jgi:hypothetical protein
VAVNDQPGSRPASTGGGSAGGGSAGGGLGEVLQLSTERFAGQFGDAPWGLVVTSLEPGRPGRCLTVSETFGRQSGYGPAELIGKDFLSIIHPEDQPALDDLIGHLAAGAIGQIGIEARMLAKDGSAVVLQLDGRALKAVDGTGYLAIYTQDSTEIVRLRAELRQLESELTRSRRLETLGQLTEGIAHDFNNLLTVIASYSSLVNDEITVAEATEGTSKWGPVRWDVRQIEDAAERARRLIKHLMAFARREQTEPVTAELGDLAADATELLRQVIGEHIEISVWSGGGLWPVKVDPSMLRQAIINVAINARDAMPAGGRITLSIDNVDTTQTALSDGGWIEADQSELAELLPGRHVRLRITDTGTGMDQVVAERAFEPFFTTKGGDATAGLGLSAVRRFAAGAGGKAWLTSKPGYGTTVTILLPAAQSAKGIVPHQGYQGARASAGTIVVVDDEPAIRDVAHRVLTAAGYHVTTAANGLEALTLLADPAAAADLVLADVVMPGITAQDFLARLRQLRPDIKVLFMSGYERPDEAAGWPEPVIAVIAKPFSRPALLMRITQAMSSTSTVTTISS